MTEKLKELYELVEEQCKHFDRYEKVDIGQTWKYHISRVIENAVEFARDRGGDVEVVEVAALFHDYANLLDFKKYDKVHHIASGDLAEPILLKRGYSRDFIDKVKKCIFAHRGSVPQEKTSIEEICLADADAVTHIENVFEIIMWRGKRGDTIREGNDFVKRKITNSYAKLSPEGKAHIKNKYEAALKIFY